MWGKLQRDSVRWRIGLNRSNASSQFMMIASCDRVPYTVRQHSYNQPHAKSPSQSQSRTTCRGDVAGPASHDSCRRRLRQDARADDAHRLADPDRTGRAERHPGRDVYEQGGEGNAGAAVVNDADQYARHVDRHVPWLVQSPVARALPRRRLAANISNPGFTRPAVHDQAFAESKQYR